MERLGQLVDMLTHSILYGRALPPLPDGTTAAEIRQAMRMAEHRAEVLREAAAHGC